MIYQLYQSSLIPIPTENLVPKGPASFALRILTGGEVTKKLLAGLAMRPGTGGPDASVEVQQEALEFFAVIPEGTEAVLVGASRSMVKNQKAFLHLLYAPFRHSCGFLPLNIFLCRAGSGQIKRGHFLCNIDGQQLQTFLDC